MERFQSLGRWQKTLLLFMAAMIALFSLLYPRIIAREGFAYQDAILVPSYENGSALYCGKIQGKPAQFTVSQDKTVYFQYDGKSYGPYTARQDPTAIPEDSDLREAMVGVEIRQGEEIFFRGGVLVCADFLLLYNEDESTDSFKIIVENGTVMDEFGNVIDPMEPSASEILELMGQPELTHKGSWSVWFAAVFICILNALSILFADELFRWRMALRIRNANCAEPSELEIASRHITWTLLALSALIIFFLGLQ